MCNLSLQQSIFPDALKIANVLPLFKACYHYNDVKMGAIASQITSLTIVYSIVYSDADQRKHQSSASLAFVRGIHRGPVNSPHKGPFDDVIMIHVYLTITDQCHYYVYCQKSMKK